MANLPNLGLALLRTAITEVVIELKRTVRRVALRLLVLLCAMLLLMVAVGTCVVIGVIHLIEGLLGIAQQWTASGWLADVLIGSCLLLIPALVLLIAAVVLRKRRTR